MSRSDNVGYRQFDGVTIQNTFTESQVLVHKILLEYCIFARKDWEMSHK